MIRSRTAARLGISLVLALAAAACGSGGRPAWSASQTATTAGEVGRVRQEGAGQRLPAPGA